jgi:predicted acetyltransferase
MNILNTQRLELFPLSQEQLIWYLDERDKFTEYVGLTSWVIASDILLQAIKLKIDKMADLPLVEHPWITYWMIRLKENSYGIGMLGFKGVPDYIGQVEIGYGIDPSYQNQAYTTEAARRLIQWAFEDPRCQRIIAPNTKKDNPASNRVLEKLGLRVYNETPDAFSWAIDRQDFDLNQSIKSSKGDKTC